MLPTKFWAEMTWRDFAAADMRNVVAVLPVAATEQHGPHLPVGTDTFISEGYFAHTMERLPADLPVLFLPVQAIGKSDEHIEYPGTLTFSPETLIRAWTGDRRQRRADRMPQAHRHELARRQRSHHRHSYARIAQAIRHAGDPGVVASTGLSRWRLFGQGARARHPWRRRRNLADARLPAAIGEERRKAEFRQRGGVDRKRIQTPARDAADRLGVDGERPSPARRCRAMLRTPRPSAAKRWPRRGRRSSSSSSATSSPSISRGCVPGRCKEK